MDKKFNELGVTLAGIKIALAAVAVTLVSSAIPFVLSRYQKYEFKNIAENIVIAFYLISAGIFLYLAWKIKIPKN